MSNTFIGTAADDTYIAKEAATTNYGTENYMYVGYDGGTYLERGLVKWDVSLLPVGADVTAATISFWMVSESQVSNKIIAAYRQLKAWNETGATYNKYNGTDNWTSAGGFNAADCEQVEIGSVTVNNGASANTQFDMTVNAAKVEDWIDGGLANNGVLLKYIAEDSAEYTSIHSAESTTAGYRPRLTVVYNLPGGDNQVIWIGL